MSVIPTLFTDDALAEMEKSCQQLLQPASQMHGLVLDTFHLVQDVRAGRQREKVYQQNQEALQQALQDRDRQIAGQADDLVKLKARLSATEETLRQVQATANEWHQRCLDLGYKG